MVGSIVGMLLRAFFNTVTLTSLLAPSIMNINLVILRDSIALTGTKNAGLASAIQDPTVLGLLDYRNQFYTLLLALVFYIASNFAFYWDQFFRNAPGDAAVVKIMRNKWIALHAVISLFSCVIITIISLSGFFGAEETILKYVKPTAEISIMDFPPLDSFVTIFRAALVVLGAYTAFMIRLYRH
jgi:hypothetical protein